MKPALIGLLLLLGACANPRQDRELSRLPVSRNEAAALLRAELGEHGCNVRNVQVESSELAWEEHFAENRASQGPAMEWVSRNLSFSEISRLGEVEMRGAIWVLTIHCGAGQVTLGLNERDAALRTRAAMQRLRHPD